VTSSAYVTILSLTPGQCMQISAIPYASDGVTLLPSFAYVNPSSPVTCGCPGYSLLDVADAEPTGAPINVTVIQVRKWNGQHILHFLYDHIL
jgi:hypothetical protein